MNFFDQNFVSNSVQFRASSQLNCKVAQTRKRETNLAGFQASMLQMVADYRALGLEQEAQSSQRQ